MLKNKYDWKVILLWSILIASMFLIVDIFRQSSSGFYTEISFFIPFFIVVLWGIFAGLRYAESDDFLRTFAIIKNPFITLLIVMIFFHTSFSLWTAIYDPIENTSFIENLLHVCISFLNVSMSIVAIPFFMGFVPASIMKLLDSFFRK